MTRPCVIGIWHLAVWIIQSKINIATCQATDTPVTLSPGGVVISMDFGMRRCCTLDRQRPIVLGSAGLLRLRGIISTGSSSLSSRAERSEVEGSGGEEVSLPARVWTHRLVDQLFHRENCRETQGTVCSVPDSSIPLRSSRNDKSGCSRRECHRNPATPYPRHFAM